ncbi:MAG: homocysteine S-methyltransferase family protein [Clostridia bacterium]|nr:homocysteine S-methyltransferase family protein [Clostridia bacterium]
MNFLDFLQQNIVLLDGGMGTLLQERGLAAGEKPERWNITHAEEIVNVHKAYFDAGSNVVCTNTFGANTLKFSEEELEEIVKAALQNACVAKEKSLSKQEKFIALDVGPSGRLLRPYGDLDFEDAVTLFKKTIDLGVKYGAELILIETMSDCYEAKAALLAAKESYNLPVLVSGAYGADGKLTTGATPAATVALLEGMGATAVGANCSLGPKQLGGVLDELLVNASLPVLFKPNAGLPKLVNGRTEFDVTVEEFAREIALSVEKGARLIGGCCGTTPAYIQAVARAIKGLAPKPLTDKGRTVVSSYTHAVELGNAPVLIGERINPTGKKRLKQALREGDIDYLLGEGVGQQEKGVQLLDVNVGLPEIDEKETLQRAVEELQTVVDLPLSVDTSSVSAMEAALRRYNGKALINSVNGKRECMEAVFPLVKKYGGVVIALTLDEDGIPENAGGRVAIAEKILKVAEQYGVAKKDIVFDTLAMPVSADKNAANSTLTALKRISLELGCHTSLGVSNVSFGLPERDTVNATFFALALENGLSAAIVNPYSAEMMKTYYAYNALKGWDKNCAAYVEKAAELSSQTPPSSQSVPTKETEEEYRSKLQRAIIKGFKDSAGALTKELLKTADPLEIVHQEIIPALNTVGEGFEQKKIYLPQLLTSAEAAGCAFEQIKSCLAKSGVRRDRRSTFVLATVHGDIHDIGKNIVKLLLENYGFDVVDLGKDVPPEKIVGETVKRRAPMVGLSALMTTTLPAMEETVRQLREKAPWCKIVVGGAVLTEEYAEKLGADQYAKDAMETVRFAESVEASEG